MLDEGPHESEAVTKAAEHNSIKDKRVYTEMYESEADAKIISGNWVLKPNKARCVLRGFEEDVKDPDVVASTTKSASSRMVLSQGTDLRSEGYTVITADVKTAFLDAHMKDGDVVYARPPPEWQLENTGHPQRYSDLKTKEKFVCFEERTETTAGPSGRDPQEVWLRGKHA